MTRFPALTLHEYDVTLRDYRITDNENVKKLRGWRQGLEAVEELAEGANTTANEAKNDSAEAVADAMAALQYTVGKYLEPIATAGDLATTYPNAEENDRVFVKDTGFIYILQDGAWVNFAEMDVSPIFEVEDRVNQKFESLVTINVYDFKKEAGETNDQGRIERAIAYGEANHADGFSLYFPLGVYNIGVNGVRLPSNVRLFGDGGLTIFKQPDGVNARYVITNKDKANGAKNIAVHDIYVDANQTNNTEENVLGIRFSMNHGSIGVLEDISVYNCYVYDSMLAIGSVIYGYEDPSQPRNNNIAIFNNTIKKGGNKAIELSETNYSFALNNYIEDFKDGVQCIFWSDYNVISGNIHKGMTHTGINITHGSSFNRVIGNHVESEMNCMVFRVDAKTANSLVEGNVVALNTFISTNTEAENVVRANLAFFIHDSIEQSENIYRNTKILNNHFKGSFCTLRVQGGSTRTGQDILIEEIEIAGNWFEPHESFSALHVGHHYGSTASHTTGVVIRDNRFLKGNRGLLFNGKADDVLVEGNRFLDHSVSMYFGSNCELTDADIRYNKAKRFGMFISIDSSAVQVEIDNINGNKTRTITTDTNNVIELKPNTPFINIFDNDFQGGSGTIIDMRGVDAHASRNVFRDAAVAIFSNSGTLHALDSTYINMTASNKVQGDSDIIERLKNGRMPNNEGTMEVASRDVVDTGLGRKPQVEIWNLDDNDDVLPTLLPFVTDTFTGGEFKVRLLNIATGEEDLSTPLKIRWKAY